MKNMKNKNLLGYCINYNKMIFSLFKQSNKWKKDKGLTLLC